MHGISDEEIAMGPDFVEAWRRFLHWTEDLLNTSVVESETDTDDEEAHLPRPLPDPPVLLLAAHNGAEILVVRLACSNECI